MTAPKITHSSFNCPESWLTHLQFTPTITSKWPLVSFCFPGSPHSLIISLCITGQCLVSLTGTPLRFPGLAPCLGLEPVRQEAAPVGLGILPSSPKGAQEAVVAFSSASAPDTGVRKITASLEPAHCQSSCPHPPSIPPWLWTSVRPGQHPGRPNAVLGKEVPGPASSSSPGRHSWRRRKSPHEFLFR